MANEKQFTIEIKMNDDAELGTSVLFMQRLINLVAKFGLTYFREVVLYANYQELARYETNHRMHTEIKDFQDKKLREQFTKMGKEQPEEIQ